MLLYGNNLESLKKLEDNSIDSIVTDPPYGLKFMGKKWDHDVPSVEFWKECLRVLKPGGHVLSFGGTRTYHRMAVNIEDAGFEIRDQIMWLYGSGFPKSHNVGKKLPEYEGFGTALKPANEPIVLARKPLSEKTIVDNVLKWGTGALNIDECRVEYQSEKDFEAVKEGVEGGYRQSQKNTSFMASEGEFRTAEPRGRWPANVILDEVAGEMLDEQSGVLKSGAKKQDFETAKTQGVTFKFGGSGCESSIGGASRFFYCAKASKKERNAGLDCNELIIENESWEKLDLSSDLMAIQEHLKGISEDTLTESLEWNTAGFGNNTMDLSPSDLTFITSITLKTITELKTLNFCLSLNTKDFILDVLNQIQVSGLSLADCVRNLNQLKKIITNAEMGLVLGVNLVVFQMLSKIKSCAKSGNFHSTVKPIKLMEYLIKLITPPNGVVLDPFMGSGSTGVAAKNLGFDFVGIEIDEDYFKIATKRIENAQKV